MGDLYLRAKGDLELVMSTNTNGARLMTARAIKRRELLRTLEVLALLICSIIVSLVDRLDPEFRWVIPVLLTSVVFNVTLNAILDSRSRKRLIDYIERLEARALIGERP